MSSWARNLMWVWLLVIAGACSLNAASSAENKDYSAALQAFNDHFWDRADRELGAFLEKYPASEFRAEGVLFQAESRIKLGEFASAIELIEAGQKTPGKYADEYLFWLAEAQLQSGKPSAAADSYASFVSAFPDSPRLLDAIVAEASARSQLKQWPRVVDLLSKPDGRFQQQANASPALPASVRGRFLLAEAQLAQENHEAALAAIEPLVNQPLAPQLACQRDYLRARILQEQGLPEQALGLATNVVAFSANLPALNAEGNALEARILEQLTRTDQAIAAWRLNLAPAVPAERQREALLNVGGLLIAQGRQAEAAQTIEAFLAAGTNAATADIALLTLGELRMRMSLETNAPTSTNLLSTALQAFDTALSNYPSSTFVGKVQLGRGWCLWLMDRVEESAPAFQAAAGSLPPSYDQSVAWFKLADALATQKKYAQALASYNVVAENIAGLDAVQTNLVERALYQVVRMARESGDPVAANKAMAALLEKFPNGFLAERSLMSLGSEPSSASDPAAAREVFLAFAANSPNSKLLPEVQLAIARTYEQERDWTNALAEYDSWLATFADNPVRPRAEYYKALATSRLGDESAALTLFTNYVAEFPTNEYTARALWWTADYYWRQEDFVNAEANYQLLFKNHPASTLRYDAQLMAGRAATARGRPEEAVGYFTNLTSDAYCPAAIQAQALFAYGDTLMALPSNSTNKPYGNLELAIQVFSKLAQLNPNTRVALLAQGKMGHCYLQLGGVDTNAALANYNFASNAYQRVLTATNHAEFADRAEAEVGLGLVMEMEARLMNSSSGVVLLRGAQDHYLNVVYGNTRRVGEPTDMFWVYRAGVERALPLAESLQDWDQVARLCDTLAAQLPSLQPMLEKRRARAEEQARKVLN